MEKSNGAATGRTLMEVGGDEVAIITIDNPPVNLLTVEVLLQLKESCEEALRRDDVKAIVITGSKGQFSGGFNVTAFGKKAQEEKLGFWSINFFTDTLEAARKPLVAAISGAAMGGGLEIALACHARISTSSARLGLTELQYGILPGFGGTQRLPRLVGLPKALEMILMSKLVNGDNALRLGLVDAVATVEELVDVARCWALDIYKQRKAWVASLYRTDKLVPLAEARLIFKHARIQVKKQAPNVRHPSVCIDVIEEGVVSGPRIGLWKESKALLELRQSDTCKSLVHFFFAQRGTSKVPGITNLGLVPRKISRVAIVGGGLMGSGIATVLILSKYPVILKEVNQTFLSAGIDRVKVNLQALVNKGSLNLKELDEILTFLTGVLDYQSFSDVDLVIEAVSENISLKQKIFVDLEKYCPQHCIFASNTSTINLDLISEGTKSHNRIVGAHFFSPAQVVPLLEIVCTERSSPQVVVDLLNIGRKMKKVPIVVRNCRGFAVSRMFFPYTQVAMMLAEHGVNIYQIDKAVLQFGMPMGPFRMMDLVGFGAATAVGKQFLENFPKRSYRSMLIPLLQEGNRAGESMRKGFYLYDNKRKATPDPDIAKYVDKARSISGVTVDSKLMKISDQDIIEMIFFPVVSEACRILEEKIVVKPTDLDVAAVLGMGFPAYRGGIIFWADTLRSGYVCSKLNQWSKKYGAMFKPCAWLAERASKGISLGSTMQAQSQL